MKKTTSFSKIVSSAAIGNVLEYYDFTLFVYLAPQIGPLFFPEGDRLSAIIAALGVYALGYFMRPIGAILFGYIGDTYGRKEALTTSIIMMAIPTILIGCLPTYSSIGILSPILLTLCRLLQGLSVGGEYNGASIFAVENVKHKQAFAGSFISASSALGALCGSLVASFVSLSFMPPWAWRGAFLSGALVAALGLYMRIKIQENTVIEPKLKRAPLIVAIKNYPRSILCCMGISAFSGILFNLSLTYVGIYLSTFKHWPLSQALWIVGYGMILYVLLAPVVGKIADRVGARMTMLTGAIATIASIYPILYVFMYATSLSAILLSVSLLVGLTAWALAPLNYYFTTLFPPECRYTGIAFSYSTTMAIFGGTTSMILTYAIRWAENPLISVVYVLLGACIGLLAILKSKPNFGDSLITEQNNPPTQQNKKSNFKTVKKTSSSSSMMKNPKFFSSYRNVPTN